MGIAANEYSQLSGSYSADINGDDWSDLVSRNSSTGELLVYPHTTTFSGTSTFAGPLVLGYGWNIMNWIALAEITDDDYPDILARRASDGTLFVYPHSGTLNGTSTFLGPIAIGFGWNMYNKMLISDVTNDGYDDIVGVDTDFNLWTYPHTRTFSGTSTFSGRVGVGQFMFDSWLLLGEWTTDTAPDLIRHSFGSGFLFRQDAFGGLNGSATWRQPGSGTQVSDAVFKGEQINLLSLCDVNGDGYDDIIAREVNGTLRMYPASRSGGMIGTPVVIGWGWQIMDIIT